MNTKNATFTFLVVAVMASAIAYAEKTAGQHVDDSILTARVKMSLIDASVTDAVSINVETSKGVVQLSGFIDSDAMKSVAGEIARETEGVEAVSNRLRVYTGQRSAGRKLDDSILAAKIKLKLLENDDTSGTKVNVEVRDAVVELSGFVPSYEERDTAVKLVSGIDNVKDVLNSIDISE